MPDPVLELHPVDGSADHAAQRLLDLRTVVGMSVRRLSSLGAPRQDSPGPSQYELLDSLGILVEARVLGGSPPEAQVAP